MCELEKYGSFRRDPCLVDKMELINAMKVYRTLASCCGHGKYPEVIVVIARNATRVVQDYKSKTPLGIGRRKRNRYFRRDSTGHYYIPEVLEGLGWKVCPKNSYDPIPPTLYTAPPQSMKILKIKGGSGITGRIVRVRKNKKRSLDEPM